MPTSIHGPSSQSSAWFETGMPNAADRIRVFCFPYAGGSWYVYRDWRAALAADVDVYPVQIPGRGRRCADTPFSCVLELAAALATDLLPYTDRPFVLLGHSMGSMIAFELARTLLSRYNVQPAHLIVSGRPSPRLARTKPPIADLPDADFIRALRGFGGPAASMMDDLEAMQPWLPMLRADMQMVEQYRYQLGPPLTFPVTALGGHDDVDVPRSSLEAWRQETTGSFEAIMMPGDHFFLTSTPEPVHDVVRMAARRIQRNQQSTRPSASLQRGG